MLMFKYSLAKQVERHDAPHQPPAVNFIFKKLAEASRLHAVVRRGPALAMLVCPMSEKSAADSSRSQRLPQPHSTH